MMRPLEEQLAILQQVQSEHGPGWRYCLTVEGLGPDNMPGTVDIFDNNESDRDKRRSVCVLNGKVLQPS